MDDYKYRAILEVAIMAGRIFIISFLLFCLVWLHSPKPTEEKEAEVVSTFVSNETELSDVSNAAGFDSSIASYNTTTNHDLTISSNDN